MRDIVQSYGYAEIRLPLLEQTELFKRSIGEVKVALINFGREDYTVEPNARIAQMVIAPIARCDIAVVEALDETSRGAGGFGSTGT